MINDYEFTILKKVNDQIISYNSNETTFNTELDLEENKLYEM